tara:strand:- start:719 stop:1918 length:1200 start_codon:yes stop_codon:yes gene_type:complete
MKEKTFDIVIIGAGLSGLLVAYDLSLKGLNIAIVDKNDFTELKNLNADFRTTAIAEGSKKYLDSIKFWKKISKHSQSIKKIKVIDRTIDNTINFINPSTNSNLGYIVENKYIKKALVQFLNPLKNVFLMKDSQLQEIEKNNDFAILKFKNKILKSKLVVAADGKNSFVRKLVKTPVYKKNYKHNAMVINLCHSKYHKNTALEIFYNTGPLAVLPMKKKLKNSFCSSIVWSNNFDYLSNLQYLNEDYLKLILEEKLKNYLGNIIKIDNKKIFPLSAHINSSFYDHRMVYLGDSAHSIHPIAGQGWNIGIRDIKNLSLVIDEGLGLGLDLGDNFICKKFNDLSFQDSYRMYQVTDKLNSIFLNENLVIKSIRNIGFKFINQNKKVNNFISTFAMGNNQIFY